MKWSELVKGSFAFGLNPKRFGLMYLIDAAFAVFLISVFINFFWELQAGAIAAYGSFLLPFFMCIFVAYGIIKLYVEGAFIANAKQKIAFLEKENTKKAFMVSKEKIVELVIVSVIISAAGLLTVFLPDPLAFIAGLLVTLLFFFAYQEIIIKGGTVKSSLAKSYRIFARYPVDVIALLGMIMAVSVLLIMAFSLPLVSLLSNIFYGVDIAGFVDVFNVLTTENIIRIIAAVLFMVIPVSYTRVFSIYAKTYFFMKKR